MLSIITVFEEDQSQDQQEGKQGIISKLKQKRRNITDKTLNQSQFLKYQPSQPRDKFLTRPDVDFNARYNGPPSGYTRRLNKR